MLHILTCALSCTLTWYSWSLIWLHSAPGTVLGDGISRTDLVQNLSPGYWVTLQITRVKLRIFIIYACFEDDNDLFVRLLQYCNWSDTRVVQLHDHSWLHAMHESLIDLCIIILRVVNIQNIKYIQYVYVYILNLLNVY